MRLVALKSLLYGTRRLQPGEEFDAKPQDAKVLIYAKRARDVMRTHLPPPPPELVRHAAEKPEEIHHDRDLLRARAEAMGIEIDRRWGAVRLQDEIDAALATYAAKHEPAPAEIAPEIGEATDEAHHHD